MTSNKPTTSVEKQPKVAQRDDAKLQKAQATSSSNPFYYYVSPTNKQSAVLKNSIPKQSEQQSPRSRSREKKHKDSKNNYIRNSSQRKSNFHSKKMPIRDSVQNPKEEAYYKTKLCPLFPKGQCKKGDNCSYAHGEKQLRLLPNLKKTKLCIAFKQGKCGKPSNQCKYAHGESQLRRVYNKESQYKKSRSPLRKSENTEKLNMAYMINPNVSLNTLNTPQVLSNGYMPYPQASYPPYPTTGNNYFLSGNSYPPSGSLFPSSGNIYPGSGNQYPRNPNPNPQGKSNYPPSGYPPVTLPNTYPPGSFMPGTMPPNYYYHGNGESTYPYTYGNGYNPQMHSRDKQFY